jgi:hypothetical protein
MTLMMVLFCNMMCGMFAECVELTRMRDHGKTAKELAGLFGYEEKYLTKVAALGFIPGLSKLAGCDGNTQESVISIKDAHLHILPIRIWPASIPKNDKALDHTLSCMSVSPFVDSYHGMCYILYGWRYRQWPAT